MTDTTTAIATTAPNSTPAKPRKLRERRVTAKLRQAIELLETGECTTQKAACARVGITEQYLSRSLKMVHVGAFIARRRAQNIDMGSLRASRRFVELIDAESEHVAAKVSRDILITTGNLQGDNAGGSKVSVNISTNITAGYVIDLSGDALITNQQHNGAKPLRTIDAIPNEESEQDEA